ncbi:MAG: TRAP transporter substrate-binding protein [Alphaproteobacteria bacterium]|nr:TRAP transporter substrate-binding protein [Alphaproteobacteria bacterium]
MRFTAMAAAAAVALAGTLAASEVWAEEKWDMPMAYAAGNFHSENGVKFAEAVTAASGGKLEVVVHASGSLFKGNEIKRAVQTGQAPIGERLISALGNEDPLFEIDALPFLATGYGEAMKLYQATKPALEETLGKQNLVLLYAVPWPPQGLYANKPIESAADMKGVKFRAYNAATARLAELMGAIPTQIEAAEISQAFATGVAESMISSGSTGYDRKLWEHTSHWYNIQAWLPKNMVIANKKAFEGLDAATQKVILEAAAKAEKDGWAKSEELANWYIEQLAGNGMTVGPAGDKLKADFQKIGQTMLDEWLAKAGDGGKALVDTYRSSL